MNPISRFYAQRVSGRLAHPTVLKNTAWLSVDKSVALVCGFGISILAARWFGPAKFGQYSYFLSFAGIFMPLMSLGLDRILMREMRDHPNAVRSILVTAFLSRVIASLLVGLLGLLLLSAFDDSNFALLAVGVLFISQSFHSYRVYNMWFQHKSLNDVIARYRIVCLLIGSAGKIAVLFASRDIILFILVVCVEQIVINVGHYVLYSLHSLDETEKRGGYSFSIFARMFEQSKFLILSGFAYLIYLRIDVIMLSKMIGNEEAGIYSAAARITEACQVFPEALLMAMFPRLLTLHKSEPQEYLHKLGWLFQLLFFAGLIVATLGFVLSPFVIPWLFGEKYLPSVNVIQIHLWACCFIYMRSMLSHWLVAESFAQFSLVSHGLGAVVNLALNFLLIPEYGAQGAAYATILAVLFSTYLCLPLSSRTRPVFVKMSAAFNVPRTVYSILKFGAAR